MKKIHVLPTDKPSRLLQSLKVVELLDKEWLAPIGNVNRNIYITSDEEIKEGDWFMSDFNSFPLHNIKELSEREGTLGWKQEGLKNNLKIILTTDQDLIKDGVQAIDDEFLEWFVKNPSCEFVNIRPLKKFKGEDEVEPIYKIIITKEEPKQIDEKGRPMTYWGGLAEPKQETIEEVLRLWNWLNDGYITRKSLPTREELIGWFEQFKTK